ncbi:hypothetical protein [Nonomuraea typhae]|uniref:Uncharacterized protein n=1 Tax=Nonomuraea typhae TaxID=2603600 RepID=A0ABW7ZB88_9ACTN
MPRPTQHNPWERFFDPARKPRGPQMAAAAAALDNLADQDDFDRVAAAVVSKRRIAQLAERRITVKASICPCYLRDSRGNLHRRRHRPERPGLCYLERQGSGMGDMVDHLRGWFRERKLIAYTLEPYHEVDAEAFGVASQALAEDDLVMSVCSCCAVHYPGQTLAIVITRKEDERPTHLITRL